MDMVPHLRKLLSVDGLHGDAAVADERPGLLEDQRPQAKAVLFVTAKLPVQPFLHFFVRKGPLVGVHGLFVL